MLILGLLGMYFDDAIVEFMTFLLLFRLAVAILWDGTESKMPAELNPLVKVTNLKSIFSFSSHGEKRERTIYTPFLAQFTKI